MNMSVENGDVNVDYFYINSSTVYVINNHNYIDYTKNIYESSNNRHVKGNNGLLGGVGIDDMLPASAPNQYVNME